MPKRGQRVSAIARIENTSALAVTGRQRLAQLAIMLDSIYRRGGLSTYNHTTAAQDIAEVTGILWALQDELCKFRNGGQE